MGAIHMAMFPNSIKSPNFLEFLKSVRQKCGDRQIKILLDNASIHKTNTVKEYCAENKIQIIWNVPYCPWFNGTVLDCLN